MLVRRDADRLQYALKVVPVARVKERKHLAQARQEYRVGQMLDHPMNEVGHALSRIVDSA